MRYFAAVCVALLFLGGCRNSRSDVVASMVRGLDQTLASHVRAGIYECDPDSFQARVRFTTTVALLSTLSSPRWERRTFETTEEFVDLERYVTVVASKPVSDPVRAEISGGPRCG
jgi:hypothetical protein